MSKQSPRQALKEAYNNLLPENKSLVNRKSLSGEFTPQALIEQLAELKSYGKKAASYQTSWHDQRTGYLEVNRRKVNTVWFVCGIIVAVIVYFRVNDSDLIWLGQGLLALSIVLPLIWGAAPLLANLQVSGKLIDADGLNLLLPLLLVLTDEIRPGSRIKLELYLGAASRGKHKVKTQKNYKILTHRVIMRSWIGLVLLIGVYSILSMVNPQIFPPVIPFFVLPIIIVFYVFIYLIIFSIASSAFGKSPKVKARFLKIPRILIQAQLADGTLFQIDLTHWIIQKTAFKKKTKFKNFQLHKKKKKYKAKAVTSLKLAFPQKRYNMHPERFKGKFNRKLYISGKQVAKMKLKPGEKRQTIVYQHVQAKQGTGHNPATLPYPTFKQFTQLVIEGGYDRLRKKPQTLQKRPTTRKRGNKAKIEQAEEQYSRDDLTLIKGVGQSTKVKLNREGVIAFQQIVDMELSDFEDVLRHLDLPHNKAKDWQNQARSLA
ncbi:hypothetical protein BKI52_01230 [marine bacterium AO1-C]|nr:hypothetical protein BKI52_01230 [marine bacterium AO1-C]